MLKNSENLSQPHQQKQRHFLWISIHLFILTSRNISGGAPKKAETSSRNPTTSPIARPPMMGQAIKPHRIGTQKRPSKLWALPFRKNNVVLVDSSMGGLLGKRFVW